MAKTSGTTKGTVAKASTKGAKAPAKLAKAPAKAAKAPAKAAKPPAKAAKASPKPAATKPTKPPAAATISAAAASAAMPWAADAWGLSRVRAGFGKTAEDDRLFALGYPHIVVPTDDPEPKDARDPGKMWKVFPRRSVTHVPRSMLAYVYGYHSDPHEAATMLAGPPPVWDVATEMTHMFQGDDRMLFLLEAMAGSEVVAKAAVDRLCAYPEGAWRSDELDRASWNVIHNLGYVLLRVSPASREALLKKLEALFAKIAKAQGKEWWRPLRALDVILHGRAGVERSECHWTDLAHARDDAAWVAQQALGQLRTMKPADRAMFDGQLAFVGGAKVVDAMRDLKRLYSEEHANAKRQLARIA